MSVIKLRQKDIPDSLRMKIRNIRNKWANKGEFTNEQILPEMEIAVADELSHVNVNNYFAKQLNQEEERREAAEKKTPDGFFSYDRIIPLGDGASCRVGKLNTDRILRRKRVIDRNQISQQKAWSEETEDLDEKYEALKGYPKKTVIEDILNEDGSPKEAKHRHSK
jgi:hypothetical protein